MYQLSDFSEIGSFNENTVTVMRNGRVFVKKRILKEAKNTYKLLKENKHNNICNVIEVFEFEDTCVVIEEYIQGISLFELLEEKKTLSIWETKKIISQICDGLLFLHKHNIIHRDINPNNIMIDNNGNVKIIDFDISRNVKKNASHDTAILGTVGYAAPEQFGFAQSDERTDIYALGVLANVMLTGMLPNEKICDGRMGKVIKKAVRTDLKSRYKNISDFKHRFTNEIDETTNTIVKVLRHIPGFRTLNIWKMIFATVVYLIYVPIICLFLFWSLADIRSFVSMVFGLAAMFIVPYVFVCNLFDIRNVISQTKIKSFAVSAIISVICFFVGVTVVALVLNKIL